MGEQDDRKMMWQGPPQDALVSVPLDVLTMIYDRRSAQTHVVASPVPEILGVFGETAMSEAAILAQLAATYDLEDMAGAAQVLRERLLALQSLGLIVQAPQ